MAVSIEGGSGLTEDAHRHEFGELLLHLSSTLAIAPDLEAESSDVHNIQDINPFERPSRAAAAFLRSTTDSTLVHIDFEIARGYYLLFEGLPQAYARHGKNFAAVTAAFYNKHMCDPDDVWFLAATTLITTSNFTLDQFGSKQPGIERTTYFQNFNWTDERIDRTLKILTTSIRELRTPSLLNQLHGQSPFDTNPLLAIANQHIVIDPQCLARYIGETFFAVMADTLETRSRELYLTCLGEAIERYIVDIANSAAIFGKSGSNVLDVEEQQEGYDILIEDGRVLSAFEVKRDTISNDAIQSHDIQRYANEVSLSKTFTKAPKQLSGTIDKLATMDPPSSRIHLGVVACHDAFSFLCVQQQFSSRFFAQHRKSGVELSRFHFVRPIVVSMREWEKVCTIVASGRRFCDCFDAIIAWDKLGEYPAEMSLAWKEYVPTMFADDFLDSKIQAISRLATKHLIS
jgi:hypothetical protein